jgi:hypothetical protein
MQGARGKTARADSKGAAAMAEVEKEVSRAVMIWKRLVLFLISIACPCSQLRIDTSIVLIPISMGCVI